VEMDNPCPQCRLSCGRGRFSPSCNVEDCTETLMLLFRHKHNDLNLPTNCGRTKFLVISLFDNNKVLVCLNMKTGGISLF
jgi:hypothetical protein